MKFALHSLHFTKPASPCDSQCSLLHTCSLKDRRANAGLLFLNDLLVGNIKYPCLLGCINFNVPARNLPTMVPFLDRAVRTNYARNEPLLRALRLLNSLPSSIRFSWGAKKDMLRQTLREYFKINFQY